MSVSTFCLCVALLVTAAPPKDIDEKGKISVGVHKLKMHADTIYHIRVEGNGFQPEVVIQPGRIIAANPPKKSEILEMLYLPLKTEDVRILVGLNVLRETVEANNDYTLKVEAFRLDKTPILTAKKELTDDDPKYAKPQLVRRESHYKAFPIKLKAKAYYVIDMIRDGDDQQFDPFLYLEDADGDIVATDDDSGGDLNARIVFQPRRSGEYRIIASTLTQMGPPATGPFTLTVRTQQAKAADGTEQKKER
ncbi:MAG TPA: hypothetical protein VHR72_09355 [Gemmataceae bacterium]|jgi:hypothetical protein|nr:hypothetical protein [Gemmataceae bacterium]